MSVEAGYAARRSALVSKVLSMLVHAKVRWVVALVCGCALTLQFGCSKAPPAAVGLPTATPAAARAALSDPATPATATAADQPVTATASPAEPAPSFACKPHLSVEECANATRFANAVIAEEASPRGRADAASNAYLHQLDAIAARPGAAEDPIPKECAMLRYWLLIQRLRQQDATVRSVLSDAEVAYLPTDMAETERIAAPCP